jgi:eukaryotic-like serine/threonine-protein kinase
MKLGLSGAIHADPEPQPAPLPKPAAAALRRPRLRWNWRWVVRVTEGAVLLALLAIAVRHYAERPAPKTPVHFRVDSPDGTDIRDFAVSPNGLALAYTGTTAEGESLLSIRMLAHPESREMAGSEGASMPFWSPDSRYIGFFAGGKLKTIHVEGGPSTTIADAPRPQGGSWSSDGTILFAPDSGGLERVGAGGGEVAKVTALDSSRGPRVHRSPQFLPDGLHFLFSASGRESADEIYIGSLDSGETRLLIKGSSGGIYSDGQILFVRDGALMVQAFDVRRFEFIGEPQRFPYAESVGSRAGRAPPYSVGNGVLAYRAGGDPVTQSFLWLDRSGRVLASLGEPAEQGDFALSPESRTVAVARRAPGNGASDLWLLDLVRGTASRATFDGPGVASPVWSPDGSSIAFASNTSAQSEILTVKVNALSSPELLLKLVPDSVVLDSWSPDGRVLLYTATVKGRLSLWLLSLEGERKHQPFSKGNFNYRQARFSPDGRWVAYVSDESGRDEIYLRAFPSGEERFLVSVDGGMHPTWSRNGRELFYLSAQRRLAAVSVESGGTLRVGSPHILFQMPLNADLYEVAADGRFLTAAPPEQQQRSPINVVLNWSVNP